MVLLSFEAPKRHLSGCKIPLDRISWHLVLVGLSAVLMGFFVSSNSFQQHVFFASGVRNVFLWQTVFVFLFQESLVEGQGASLIGDILIAFLLPKNVAGGDFLLPKLPSLETQPTQVSWQYGATQSWQPGNCNCLGDQLEKLIHLILVTKSVVQNALPKECNKRILGSRDLIRRMKNLDYFHC